jgi:hypothetical protein
LNTVFCQDHRVDPNDPGSDACDLGAGVVGRPEEATEEDCRCAPAAEIGCGGLADCKATLPFVKCLADEDCAGTDVCIATEGNARCHAGTWNGEFVNRLDGAMAAGDCLVYNRTTLTVTDPVDEIGADGVLCTEDDLVSEGDTSRIPLTTGSASAFLVDAIGLNWGAVCTAGRVGDLCLEDQNCNTTLDPQDGVCGTGGNSLTTIAAGPEVGSRLNCEAYDNGDLFGLQLAGAIPFADGASLGDGAFAFKFWCGNYDPTTSP